MGYHIESEAGVVEITNRRFAQPLQAGELIGLRRYLMSNNPDSYYGWRDRYGATIGRLATDAASIDEINLDIFVTTVDETPISYERQLHSFGPRDWQRVVGGRGTVVPFDIKHPVDYTDITPKRIGTSDPNYVMDGPSDVVPTVYITINPVTLYTGAASRAMMQRTLDPNNRIALADKDRITEEIMDVVADPDAGTPDFIAAAGPERIFPERYFPRLYREPSVDQAAVDLLLGT